MEERISDIEDTMGEMDASVKENIKYKKEKKNFKHKTCRKSGLLFKTTNL